MRASDVSPLAAIVAANASFAYSPSRLRFFGAPEMAILESAMLPVDPTASTHVPLDGLAKMAADVNGCGYFAFT